MSLDRYLIIGPPRSGTSRISSILANYYHSHGYDVWQVELFGAKNTVDDFFGKSIPRFEIFQFFNWHYEKHFPVFKTLYGQINQTPHEASIIAKYDKIIVTERRNKFELFLSYVIGVNSGVFNGPKKPTIQPMVVTKKQVVTLTKAIVDWEGIAKRYMPMADYVFYYEDLLDKTPNDILQLLQIEFDTKDVIVKQTTLDEKRKIVTNVDEVEIWFNRIYQHYKDL